MYALNGQVHIWDESERTWTPKDSGLSDSVHYASAFDDLNEAVTLLGSDRATLEISSADFSWGADCTVLATTLLEFTGAGSLNVPTGQEVIIRSSGKNWPIRQIFTGDGTISFDGNWAIDDIRPEWFGEQSIDDVALLNKTFAAAITPPTRRTVNMNGGPDYEIDDDLSVAGSMNISGYGVEIVQTSLDTKCFNITSGGVRISGLKLTGPNGVSYPASQPLNSVAVFAMGAYNQPAAPDYIEDVVLEDLDISEFTTDGIQLRFVRNFKILRNNIHDIYTNINATTVISMAGLYMNELDGGSSSASNNKIYS